MEEADKILVLLKQGDKHGLELLFRRFYRPLVMYALKFLPQQEEAEDVVQEVFIKFWERKRFDMIDHYLRSYLYHREVDRLPDRTREIFTAIVLNDKRYKEVAEDLGVSVNTVKTALSRALSALRSNLSEGAYLVVLLMILGVD